MPKLSLLLAVVLSSSAGAFAPTAAFPTIKTNDISFNAGAVAQRSLSILSARKNLYADAPTADKRKNGLAAFVANLALVGTIFTTSVGTAAFLPPAASAEEVELSTGAFVVRTSQQQGQSLLKTEVDAKTLFTTVFKNRKELKSSLDHISDIVKEELSSPAWTEVTKEVLQIEGDVTPQIKVIPPPDWKQTVKDVSKGKLNLIVNGEIINLSVDDKFSDTEDEIVIRAKGFKGIPFPALKQPAPPVKSELQERIDEFSLFWNSPVSLPQGQEILAQLLPEGVIISNGNVIVGGTTVFIAGSYGISYSYYLSQIAEEEARAAAKREAMAQKKKAAAEAAKKKEEEVNEEEA